MDPQTLPCVAKPMGTIHDCFPLPVPRPKQTKALDYIERAWAAGYKDVVIEAPTGSGKTSIGVAACRWGQSLDRPEAGPGGYILVHQKALQDQVEAEISQYDAQGMETRMIKGAVEYPCPSFARCSVGLRRKCACIKEGTCAYRKAKGAFLASATGITNYAYFITERQHVGKLTPRQILCLDECHGLGSIICHTVGLQVDARSFSDYAPSLTPDDLMGPQNVLEFAHWALDTYVPEAMQHAEFLNQAARDARTLQRAAEVEDHANRAQLFAQRVLEGGADGWVFWRENERDPQELQVCARPLEAGPYFEQMFGSFPFRMHLSAFPGAKPTYCRELGLDPTKVAWLRLSSTFPVENRPVILAGVGSLGRANIDESLPLALRSLGKILDAHPERGIIHTHSYELAQAVLREFVKTPHAWRFTTHRNADDRAQALAKHAATAGSVLVSPSVGEGYDFKDDLARWAAILKVPWGYMGDKWVAARQQRDPAWYGMEAVKALLQTAGRVVRSENDKAIVYVLDSDANRLLDEYKDFTPKWFLEAVKRL